MSYAADENGVRRIAYDTLLAAKSMGIKVVRTWAFSDGQRWNALQPEPHKYSEEVFRGLDWVIHTCATLGIRLVLCFTDYWGSYGGMKQYVQWCNPGVADPPVNDFYENKECQRIFQDFIFALVNRVNTFNGIMYRDDPTIMSWELANESRYKGSNNVSVVASWADVTARFVKGIDPNHLVTLGEEGFFGECSREFQSCNPYNVDSEGTDFIMNGRCGGIDYVSLHLWPDQWLNNASLQEMIQFAEKYIREHARAASIIGKPLVVEEFGFSIKSKRERFEYYHHLLGVMSNMCKDQSNPLHGMIFWMLASNEYENYDGYNIYPLKSNLSDTCPFDNDEDFTPQLLASIVEQLEQNGIPTKL